MIVTIKTLNLKSMISLLNLIAINSTAIQDVNTEEYFFSIDILNLSEITQIISTDIMKSGGYCRISFLTEDNIGYSEEYTGLIQ